MRISDWSSDVCSSDLVRAGGLRGAVERYAKALDAIRQTRAQGIDPMPHQREALDRARDALDAIRPQGSTDLNSAFRNEDRKSVVEGTSVSVRVDLGGRRIIKKKKNQQPQKKK